MPDFSCGFIARLWTYLLCACLTACSSSHHGSSHHDVAGDDEADGGTSVAPVEGVDSGSLDGGRDGAFGSDARVQDAGHSPPGDARIAADAGVGICGVPHSTPPERDASGGVTWYGFGWPEPVPCEYDCSFDAAVPEMRVQEVPSIADWECYCENRPDECEATLEDALEAFCTPPMNKKEYVFLVTCADPRVHVLETDFMKHYFLDGLFVGAMSSPCDVPCAPCDRLSRKTGIFPECKVVSRLLVRDCCSD